MPQIGHGPLHMATRRASFLMRLIAGPLTIANIAVGPLDKLVAIVTV